ncbi:MAG TPA: redoxin domain-containing protein [Sphingobacteriaceae bacterium]
MMLKLLLLSLNIILSYVLMGQPDTSSLYTAGSKNVYPQVGKRCPEFQLNNIRFYPKKIVTSADLRGKYVILDFFSKYCKACFASFPKVNNLQKQFAGKVDIFLIGMQDEGVEPMYERFRKRNGIHLPVVFDSLLVKQLVPSGTGFPYQLWIDKDGFVAAVVSGGSTMNSERLTAFIEQRKFSFVDISAATDSLKMERMLAGRDWAKYIDLDGQVKNQILRDSSLVFGSQLGRWNKYMTRNWLETWNESGSTITQGIGNLEQLYLKAFFGTLSWNIFWGGLDADLPGGEYAWMYGRFWPKPILEVKDSSAFRGSIIDGDMFWYRQIVPASSKERVNEIMQTDLKEYFDYDAGIETRTMPYYKLVIGDLKKVKKIVSNGGESSFESDGFTRISLRNIKWAEFYKSCIRNNFHLLTTPFLDETGLNCNINIKIEAKLQDPEDFRKALQKYGLDLIRGEKEMKVLVIRDVHVISGPNKRF